jgi:15-cis-phytoene synthase
VTELDRSYSLCHRYARAAASNFYYSFYLLPRAKRRAMYALYAFMRRVDDIGDASTRQSPELSGGYDERLMELGRLCISLDRAMNGQFDDELWPAIADAVRTYSIPQRYLEEVIDGVEMDVRGERFETFEELGQYCHRVAGVVGQACVRIWGFHDERALALADDCGTAFQLTNILRDLAEDAREGRVYLPQVDLDRFDYSREELLRLESNHRLERLLGFELERAETFYAKAAELLRYLHRDGDRVFRAMFGTYRALLEQVKRLGGEILRRRITLSRSQKLRIWLSALTSRLEISADGDGKPHFPRLRRAPLTTAHEGRRELHR